MFSSLLFVSSRLEALKRFATMYFNETNPPPPAAAYGPLTTCTLETCSVIWSVLAYQPSLAANVLFLILFIFALAFHVYQGWKYKTWFFTGAVSIGCICEVMGYGGRIMLHNNPFSFDGFILQIGKSIIFSPLPFHPTAPQYVIHHYHILTPVLKVIITLAPAFMCAAIYVTLSQIIYHLSSECSRFPPQLFPYLFVICDLISLVLQAAGGGVSSVSLGRNLAGVDLTLTGLGFQVFTLTLFVVLAVDYWMRYAKLRKTRPSSGRAGESVGRQESEKEFRTTEDPLTKRFKIFAIFLSVSIVCIYARCCYRIAELKQGYEGHIFHEEGTYIVFESV